MSQLIENVENKIYSRLHGVKLSVSQLYLNMETYFNGNIEEFRKLSPSQLQEIWTEINIPDVNFYGFYFIPINKPADYNIFYQNSNSAIPTEFIICIGSLDGMTADFITSIIPPYVSIEQMDMIMNVVVGD